MVPHCSSCENKLCEKDIGLVEDLHISASTKLLESLATFKNNTVYIAKFLVHKYKQATEHKRDKISNKFVKELNRRALCMPTLGIVFFVYCAISL